MINIGAVPAIQCFSTPAMKVRIVFVNLNISFIPFFLLLGDVFAFVNNTGFMFENGKIVQALIIFAEHRYYGESFPTNATPGENPYRYLSVEQALADYAFLIENSWSTNLFPNTSPVITFGGSYGGMLAAWFRQKYPHLTIGFVLLFVSNTKLKTKNNELTFLIYNYQCVGSKCSCCSILRSLRLWLVQSNRD